MGDWPVGLSTGCFYNTSIFECLARIRDAGFGLVEICSFPAHLDYHDRSKVERAANLLRRLNLEPYSFHAPFAERIDITALDPAHRQSSAREILRAAEAAATLGVRYFVIHPGPEKGGLPDHQRFERMVNAASVLNQISDRCREIGVALVLENMLPHLFSGHVRDLLWLLGALETTDVGVCLDTGHAFLSGDIHRVAHKLSGHLWMVHASDNKGEFDDHLPPGEGVVPWSGVLAQLSASGFSGALILEIAGNSDIDATLERAQRARLYLRQMAHHPAGPTSSGSR